MKRFFALVLSVMLCCCTWTVGHADSGAYQGTASKIEKPNEIDEEIPTGRGDSKPTRSITLPYNAEATISSSVFTEYYFHPSSSGYLYTKLNGSITFGSGTCKITIKLYKDGSSSAVSSHTYESASSWTNRTIEWGGGSLDPTGNYYFKISKNNALINHVSFTLRCTTSS